ncbi:MAG: hypothetical protein IKG03_04810 [Clostridiales bacterium]|nr:hypothetical protein [Clostridiales bacterium]
MKKILVIILSVAILLISGCSSASEPITTVPLDPETTTVGDVAGTVEGDRYISHVGGIAYKLNGDYTVDWPDSDKRNILMCDYTGIDICGPVLIWSNKSSMNIAYVLDEKLKADAMNEYTLEQMNSRSKYNVKSAEYVDYKIGDRSYHALKSVLENNGKEASALQIYAFQDNGMLILISISGRSFRDVDKIAKNLQFA